MQTEAQKLRINLSQWKCFALRITTDVTLEDDFIKLLALQPKNRFSRFYEEYVRAGVQHTLILRFARYLKQQNRYAISIAYGKVEASEDVPRPLSHKMEPKPSEQFLKLCSLRSVFLFRCDCSFSYSRSDEDVHFALPIKLEDELFDEIRGLRFAKIHKGKILMENSVDLVETDLMTHRVRFAQESSFTADLPQKLLKQAREISRKT